MRAFLITILICNLMMSACAGDIRTSLPKAEVVATGRVVSGADGWRFTWPGVVLTTRFEGSVIGVRLNDSYNHYTVEIDGQHAGAIEPQAGERTVWLKSPGEGPHQIDLIKRTGFPDRVGHVLGFTLDGGKWLPKPRRSQRQIEFIGDSWTAALGNLKNQRECDWNDSVANTDITQGFAVLAAKRLDAQWQSNAQSGMGMVRNWNGSIPDETFRTYYPRLLQTDAASRYSHSGWQPQVIVLGLGINDFSSPVKAGEKWTTASLDEAYRLVYRAFVRELRERSPDAVIVATATRLWPNDAMRPAVQGVVTALQAAGDKRLVYLDWGELDLSACLWHPSLADHQRMAEKLTAAINAAQPAWLQ